MPLVSVQFGSRRSSSGDLLVEWTTGGSLGLNQLACSVKFKASLGVFAYHCRVMLQCARGVDRAVCGW
jgi:hypothetical protein